MCKLASRVFFTVTTRKLRWKHVISINWKRLTAFFVIMIIFNCLTEYGLRTKKFLNLFARPFKKYQQEPEQKDAAIWISIFSFLLQDYTSVNYNKRYYNCAVFPIYRENGKLFQKKTAHRYNTQTI